MKKWISRIIILILLIAMAISLSIIYDKYYFNDFMKVKSNASYYRDTKQRCNDKKSYVIEKIEYVDICE